MSNETIIPKCAPEPLVGDLYICQLSGHEMYGHMFVVAEVGCGYATVSITTGRSWNYPCQSTREAVYNLEFFAHNATITIIPNDYKSRI